MLNAAGVTVEAAYTPADAVSFTGNYLVHEFWVSKALPAEHNDICGAGGYDVLALLWIVESSDDRYESFAECGFNPARIFHIYAMDVVMAGECAGGVAFLL